MLRCPFEVPADLMDLSDGGRGDRDTWMVGPVEVLVDFQRPARVLQRGGEIPARLVHRTRVVGRDGHVGMRFAVNVLHHLEGALREFGRIGDLPLCMQASSYFADTSRQGPDPFDVFVH